VRSGRSVTASDPHLKHRIPVRPAVRASHMARRALIS
jgi:hypothetical protein